MFGIKGKPFEYSISPEDAARYEEKRIVSESLLDFIMNKELFRKSSLEAVQELKERVIKSKLDSSVKRDFLAYITSEKPEAMDALRSLLFGFLEAEKAMRDAQECTNITDWVHAVVRKLNPSVQKYSNKQIDLAMALLLYEQSLRNPVYDNILGKFTEVYQNEGGVF